MGDMGEAFRAYDAYKRKRRAANLTAFDPTGWKKHTEWHFSKTVAGSRLDYWPTKKKWMFKGKIGHGEVDQFISARTSEVQT